MEWKNFKHNQESRIVYMVINYYSMNLILGLDPSNCLIETNYKSIALLTTILIHGILQPIWNLQALELDLNSYLVFSYSFPKIFLNVEGAICDLGPLKNSSIDENCLIDDQRTYLSYSLLNLKWLCTFYTVQKILFKESKL